MQSKSNRLATLAVAVVMLLASSLSNSSLPAQENQPAVAELLEQLDSTSFQQREAATEKLVQLGPQVLKPLVAHFFDASSEAGWRIRHILENIGRNGSEQDFLKSIALVHVLYGDRDAKAPQRLAKLQYQWKEARRADAFKQLDKQGFKFDAVENPYGGGRDAALQLAIQEMAERQIGVHRIGQIDVRPGSRESPELPITDTAQRKWQDPRIDKQASMRTVEEIIAGSADANREIAEKLLPISQSVTLPKGTLEIPADWKSDEASLKLINDLGPLSSLKLRNQKIGSDLQKFIAKQTDLKSLQLIDCKFDENDGQLVLPKSIYRYELEGSLPPPKTLESLGTISSLVIRRASLSEEQATVLAKGEIKIIELEEVEFTRQSIKPLLDIRGLLRVRISLCNFELEWFEESRRKNPNLIAAVPKAFLGVQGGLDVSGMFAGCQISEVVAGTAAAQAGMESLDVITEAEGQKTPRFEDLRLIICQKKPGETLTVKVLRGDKQLELNIKLGDMGSVDQ